MSQGEALCPNHAHLASPLPINYQQQIKVHLNAANLQLSLLQTPKLEATFLILSPLSNLLVALYLVSTETTIL